MDGGEPDMVLIRHGCHGRLRRGGARCKRFRAVERRPLWLEPGRAAKAHLNQQHQHKGTRFDPPAAWSLPAGYSVSVFRGRRLDWGVLPATLR